MDCGQRRCEPRWSTWEYKGTGLTPQVTTQHQIQHEKTVLVVLECIAQIHNKRMVDLRSRHTNNVGTAGSAGHGWAAYLFQQPALLDDVGDCLHLHALRLVDVLEGIEVASLLVLDNSNLDWDVVGAGASEVVDLAGPSGEKRTLPNAPFPTHRRRMKWKRFTSPSKSMGCGMRSDSKDEEVIGGRGYLGSTADSAHSVAKR